MGKDDLDSLLKSLIGRVVVIDASVLVKMFLNECGGDFVSNLLRFSGMYKLTVMAPPLLKYEIMNIVSRRMLDTSGLREVIKLFNGLKIGFVEPAGMFLKEASYKVFHNPKISFYDASYHALAKDMDGVFLTADKKYYDVVRGDPNVVLI